MKEDIINKWCHILVNINGANLHYLAVITGFDTIHFYFTDKYNNKYLYRLSDLVEVKEVKSYGEDKKEGPLRVPT